MAGAPLFSCPRPAWWPLFGLTVETDRLLLRPPQDSDFEDLVQGIDAGIHDPSTTPFSMAWTDSPRGPERSRGNSQHWWRNRANWTPGQWQLDLAVFFQGRAVGVQSLSAVDFAVMREVRTGSWLTREVQGDGFGKEMRSAALHLAFDGLEAEVARTEAFEDNYPSIAVSRALGYEENGRSRAAPRGTPRVLLHFEMTRARWQQRRAQLPRASVSGLEACRTMFG